jgi:hypothetical protein
MKKIFQDMFTEPDNKTFCPARLIALGLAVGGIALAVVDVVLHKRPFDLQAYGVGAGALLGGTGAALGLKKDS